MKLNLQQNKITEIKHFGHVDQTYRRKKWIFKIWFMVFNATFKNISVISWQSVLLVGET